jgi:hypothetical protein
LSFAVPVNTGTKAEAGCRRMCEVRAVRLINDERVVALRFGIHHPEMDTINYHVQHALYKFDREMKRLNHGTKFPSPAGQRSTGGSSGGRPGWLGRLLPARR